MSLAQCLRCIGYLMCGVVLTGSLLGAQLVDAATYYVATTGSDANSGSEASPFQTINRGVKALVSGDTLFINSGVYAEELKNPLPSGLSASRPTKMTGPAANRPIIRPTTSNNGGFIIVLNSNRTHITFENLVLDASAMPKAISALATNSVTMITNLVLQDCEAIGRTGTTPTGSAVTIGNNTQATVRRCSIHGWSSDTSNPGAHGFYWRGSNGLIEFNEMYDNNGYGLQFYSSSGGVNNNVFRNNYAHHNGKRGLYIGSGDGNQAYNNIIVHNNGGIGIRGRHTKIFNNTVYNNAGDGMHVGPGVVAVIRNNIIYNNGRTIRNQSNDTTIDHNLTSDPLFVDPATNNFKLQAGSPAVDAGATLSEVQDDYVNVARPQGSGYDIGAYEYTASTTSAQPTTPTGPRIIDAK
jgi:parallel beta-helix repeat protein